MAVGGAKKQRGGRRSAVVGDLESHFGKTVEGKQQQSEDDKKRRVSLQEVPYLPPSPPQGRRIRVIRAQS